MHQSSFDKMKRFKDEYLADSHVGTRSVLDIGSMDVNGSYRELFDSPEWDYLGIDMEGGKGVDVVLSHPYRWREIPSGSVDVLISGQALEHAEYFWIVMLEVFRVLKPGALCCIIAPAGGFEHRYPVDCWRFYRDGFGALAKYSQLDILSVYTQWEPEGYEDGSDRWMDSVLIARKPEVGCWLEIKRQVKRYVQYKAMMIGL